MVWRGLTARVGKRAGIAAVVCVLLVAGALVAIRQGLIFLAARPAWLGGIVSHVTHTHITVASARPVWSGIHPGLEVFRVVVSDPGHNRPIVTADSITVTAAWRSLWLARFVPDRIEVDAPHLALLEDANGVLHLGDRHIDLTRGARSGPAVPPALFTPDTVKIRDGVLDWQDARSHEAINVTGIGITLSNGLWRHQLTVSAHWPIAICGVCTASLTTYGKPERWRALSGTLAWSIQNLDIKALPAPIRAWVVRGLRGEVSSVATARFERGGLQAFDGTVAGSQLTLPGRGMLRSLAVPSLVAHIHWHQRFRGWTLSVRDATIASGGSAWQFSHLAVDVGVRRTNVTLDRMNLDQVVWLLSRLRAQEPILAAVRAADPDGRLSEVHLRLSGTFPTIDHFTLTAHARGLTAASFGPYPGFNGLDGTIALSDTGGSFHIKAMKGVIYWPRYLKSALVIDNGSGRLSWRKGTRARGYRVMASDLAIAGPLGRIEGNVDVRAGGHAHPAVAIAITAKDIDLALLRLYEGVIPVPALRAWLKTALVAGHLDQATVHLAGEPDAFPFLTGGGSFDVSAIFQGVTLNYWHPWPALVGLRGTLTGHDAELDLHGQARLGSLAVPVLGASVHDLDTAKSVLHVTGQVTGPLSVGLKVLKAAGVRVPMVSPSSRMTGSGALDLALMIPLAGPAPVTYQGNLRLSRDALALAPRWPSVAGLTGQVGFDEQGLANSMVRGTLDGAPFTLASHRAATGTRLQASGALPLSSLLALAPKAGPYVSATRPLPWAVSAGWTGAVLTRVDGRLDLTTAELKVPAPLGKAAGAPLSVDVRTRAADVKRLVLVARAGKIAGASALLTHNGAGWRLARARVTLGARRAPLPDHQGVVLAVEGPTWNLDEWRHRFHETPGHQPFLVPGPIRSLRVNVGKVLLWARNFGAVRAHLARVAGVWRGQVDGSLMKGAVRYDPVSSPQAIGLDLSTLTVPAPHHVLGPIVARSSPAIMPGRLPAIDVRAASLTWDHRELGAFHLQGHPEAQAWQIDRVHIRRGASDIIAHGVWLAGGEGDTRLSGTLKTGDLGQLLGAFGEPHQIAGGDATVTGSLHWPGDPSSFGFAKADGEFAVTAKNGRFTHLHEGAGKLLGLFDLRSITRYLSLDFSTLFREGYAFDNVQGKFALGQGVVSTPGVSVKGPSADLRIQGDADLVHETLSAEVAVDPRFRDTLTLASAGLLANPVAGAALFAIQQVFHKEIARETQMVYDISGPWASPTIRRRGGS